MTLLQYLEHLSKYFKSIQIILVNGFEVFDGDLDTMYLHEILKYLDWIVVSHNINFEDSHCLVRIRM